MKHQRMYISQFARIGIAVLSLAVLAASCSTTPTHYRGSLSDAMEKSKDDYEGDRSVPDLQRPQERQFPGGQPAYNNYQQPDPTYSGYDDGDSFSPAEFWLGFRGGNGYYGSSDMRPLVDVDITAGGEVSENLEVDLSAGFKLTKAVAGSELDLSVKDAQLFLKAGLEGRYSPLPGWLMMRPYLTAGMGSFFMGWNFRNPLVSGSDTISSDSITGFMVSVGAGVYLLRLEHFRIGIGVQPEMYLFGTVTSEGFDNDYFSYFDSIKYFAEIAVKF